MSWVMRRRRRSMQATSKAIECLEGFIQESTLMKFVQVSACNTVTNQAALVSEWDYSSKIEGNFRATVMSVYRIK